MIIDGNVRLQVKSRSVRDSSSVTFKLCRDRGVSGIMPYEDDDFDVLALALMKGEELAGLYVVPMQELISRSLCGHDVAGAHLTVDVPSLSRRRAMFVDKKGWLETFFINASSPPTANDLERLRQLLRGCSL